MSGRSMSLTASAQGAAISKFKNIFGEPWMPSTYIRNLHPNMTCDPLIQVSQSYFAVPWKSSGDGLMYYGQLNKPQRISDTPSLIHAHSQQITTFQFSPFHERLLATGSRDCTVKLWNLPPDGLTTDFYEEDVVLAHDKRITNLSFHSCVDNIIATSTNDGSVFLYDIANPTSPIISMDPFQSEVLSLEWEAAYGETLMSISKDFNCRIFDPRVTTDSIAMFPVAETVKGLKGKFIDGTDYLSVFGFSKRGERVVSLFDVRKNGLVSKVVVDNQPAPLSLFYDDNNNLMYLTGRGNNFFIYDIQGKNIINIGKSNCSDGVTAAAFIPARTYDVKKCEIGRFAILNSKFDTLYNYSFSIARKESEEIYQEDLYQNVSSGVPEYTSREWLKPCVNVKENRRSSQTGGIHGSRRRSSVSMKPNNMKSVYDVSVERGGKDRTQELLQKMKLKTGLRMKKLKNSGVFLEIQRGWVWNSFIPRWCELTETHLLLFNNRDDSLPAVIIDLLNIIQFVGAEMIDSKFPIVFNLAEDAEEVKSGKAQKQYIFFVNSKKDVDEWVATFNVLQERAEQIKEEEKQKEQEQEVIEKAQPTKENYQEKYEASGLLYVVKPSMFSTIKHRFFYIEKGVLYSTGITWWTQQPTGPGEMECFLNRIIHLSPSEGIFPPSYGKNTFQLTTKGNVIHLCCKNKEELDMWINACTPNMLKNEDEEDLDDFKRAPAQDTMQYLYPGIFGGFSDAFVSLVANEIFVFKNKTETTPIAKLYLNDVTTVEANKKTEELKINTTTNKVFTFKTPECVTWKEEIIERKQRTADVLSELGIRDNILTLDNTINEEYVQQTSIDCDALFQDTNKFLKGEPTILIQIRGRLRLRAYVIPLQQKHLNPYNSYILYCKKGMYVWQGQASPRVNRAKAIELAQRWAQKERDNCMVKVMQQGKDPMDSSMQMTINCEIQQLPKNLPDDLPNCISTDVQDKETPETIKIYRILHREESETTPLTVTLIHDHPVTALPPKELLKPRTVNLVVTKSEIFLWQSVTSTPLCRRVGSIVAKALREKFKPQLMLKLSENGEFILFKEKFSNYPGQLPIQTGGMDVKEILQVEKRPQRPMDEIMKEMSTTRAPLHTELVLNVNGKQIFASLTEGTYVMKRVEDHGLVEYPKEFYGQFFSKDAFLVLYTFYPEGKDKASYIIYFWQGRDASLMDMGTLAHKVVETSGSVDTSVQIRVVQGKEPAEFLNIFKDKFVVHLGGYTEYAPSRCGVYEIRGNPTPSSKEFVTAVEMPIPQQLQMPSLMEAPLCIMPESTYAVKLLSKVVMIKGGQAPKSHEQLAQLIGKDVNLKVVNEKPTNEEVSASIGGLKVLNDVKRATNDRLIRLFKFTFWITAVDLEEIEQPSQADLNAEFVFLIDVGKVVLWFGAKALNETKRYALQFGLELAKQRGQEKVVVETQNKESVEFRSYFHSWSDTNLLRKNNLRQEYPVAKETIMKIIKSVNDDTFTELPQILSKMIVVNGKKIGYVKGETVDLKIENVVVDQGLVFPRLESRTEINLVDAKNLFDEYCRTRYTYAELITKPRPFGVDKSILETYLSDEEFEEVFAMDRKEFYEMKPWCRDKLKHSAYLY